MSGSRAVMHIIGSGVEMSRERSEPQAQRGNDHGSNVTLRAEWKALEQEWMHRSETKD